MTQNDDLGLLEEMSRCLMPKEKLVVPENKSHSPIGNDCVASDKYVRTNQSNFLSSGSLPTPAVSDVPACVSSAGCEWACILAKVVKLLSSNVFRISNRKD